jgi:hypothetical protein
MVFGIYAENHDRHRRVQDTNLFGQGRRFWLALCLNLGEILGGEPTCL